MCKNEEWHSTLLKILELHRRFQNYIHFRDPPTNASYKIHPIALLSNRRPHVFSNSSIQLVSKNNNGSADQKIQFCSFIQIHRHHAPKFLYIFQNPKFLFYVIYISSWVCVCDCIYLCQSELNIHSMASISMRISFIRFNTHMFLFFVINITTSRHSIYEHK